MATDFQLYPRDYGHISLSLSLLYGLEIVLFSVISPLFVICSTSLTELIRKHVCLVYKNRFMKAKVEGTETKGMTL